MSGEIIVIGDVHGDFQILNKFIAKKNPSIIMQAGDFGYWPNWSWKMWYPDRRKPKPVPVVKAKNTLVYFICGNHEDHWSLRKLTNNEVFPNTFYMKRGSTLTLPDGRNVLFIGGADSYDKESRKLGIDWFPEENITQAEILSIDPNTKIDIVVSHTCPWEFKIEDRIKGHISYLKNNDCNREALSYILRVFKPSLWYFGHWHCYATGYNENCRWIALNRTMNGSGWWEVLKIT